jgi:hypothetical protein
MATFKSSTLITLPHEQRVFQLFQTSPINLFYRAEVLEETVQDLRAHKYLVHEFDCRNYKVDNALLWDVGLRLGFPYEEGWRPGLDGFNDFLSDVTVPDESGLFLAFKHFDSFYNQFQSYAHQVLEIFAHNSRMNLLYGWRFAILIQNDDPLLQFEPIGALPTSWNRKEWITKTRISTSLT